MQKFEIPEEQISEEQKSYNEDPERPILIKTFKKSTEIDFGTKYLLEPKKGIQFQGTKKELQYIISTIPMGKGVESMKGAIYYTKIQIQEIHTGTIDIGIVYEDKKDNWANIHSEEFYSKDVIGQTYYNHMYYLQNEKEVSNNFFGDKVKEGDVFWVYLDTKRGIFKIQHNDNPNERYQIMENLQDKIINGTFRFFVRFYNSKGVINVLQE